jgi:hypothetical protein
MLSRSRSQVFSRKGSIERSRASKLGYRVADVLLGDFAVISASDVGNSRAEVGACDGSWCRNDVRR